MCGRHGQVGRNQKGEDLGSMTVESLIKILKKEICDKS
jgi:hypothetical protein